MKKTINLVILLSCLVTYGQWNYRAGKSDFDGDYKIATINGTGGEFPYKNPYFNINKYSNNGVINIYFSGAGYSGCNRKKVFFKFKGDEKIYQSNYVSGGSNNDAWFISSMMDMDESELLEKLMKHNSFSVRLKSDCGLTEYSFGLNGSTKAISYVVGKDYIKEIAENKRKLKEIAELKENAKEKILSKENDFLILQKNQLKLPVEGLEKQKKEAGDLISSKYLKFSKSDFYYNKVDIKVYHNIYETKEKFIINRKTLIGIDNDYSNSKYYRIRYAGKYFGDSIFYVEKFYLNKLFID